MNKVALSPMEVGKIGHQFFRGPAEFRDNKKSQLRIVSATKLEYSDREITDPKLFADNTGLTIVLPDKTVKPTVMKELKSSIPPVYQIGCLDKPKRRKMHIGRLTIMPIVARK